MSPAPSSRWRRVILRAAIAVGLASTFYLYLRPDMVIDLAARVWSCI